MAKIALAMIVKGDEGDKLDRCLESVRGYVDNIFVTITTKNKNVSSVVSKHEGVAYTKDYDFHTEVTDKEVKWLEKFGIKPYLKKGDKIFQFDKARNYSFNAVPKEYDYILWLDADDIVKNPKGISEAVKIMEEQNLDAGYFNYLYQVEADDNGRIKNVLIQHLRERIVRNGVFKWVAPIHETLIPQKEHRSKDLSTFSVVHLSDEDRMQKNLLRNVRTLELSIYQTEGKDPRPIYYLGKAHYDEGHLFGKQEHFKHARFLFNKYLQGEYPSGWAEERGQCWDYIAEIERDEGNIDRSVVASLNSFKEYGQNPATYIALALSYVSLKDYERAKHWLKLATAFRQPNTTLVTNPKELQGRSLEVAYHIGINTANLNMALDAAVSLNKLDPSNKVFKDRLNFVMSLHEQKELTKSAITLARHLAKGQSQKLKPLLSSMPDEIANNPFITDLYKKVYPPRTHGENEIAIYCGPGFTNWSPSLMNNPNGSFMGGSEEAVVYLSRELQKIGWQVTVYGDPAEKEIDEGVVYLPYYEFNPDDTFNIFVSWRQPHLADLDLKCKGLYIWNHDVINPMDYTKERLDKITKLFVLSPAHRLNVPKIPDDKIVISANGVKTDKIEPKNNPKRVIYTSSYDRGLEHLLKVWPDVVDLIPDAELHIYYGWQLFDKFYANNPERMAWKDKMVEMMSHKGIIHHGRVTQDEILERMSEAGVWAYPTHFYEISCITAMKAQIAGCIPVTTDFAALDTTVQYGVKVSGDIYDPDVLNKFKKELISILQSPAKQWKIREEMMDWSRDWFSWSRVAEQWSDLFKGKEVNGLIPKSN